MAAAKKTPRNGKAPKPTPNKRKLRMFSSPSPGPSISRLTANKIRLCPLPRDEVVDAERGKRVGTIHCKKTTTATEHLQLKQFSPSTRDGRLLTYLETKRIDTLSKRCTTNDRSSLLGRPDDSNPSLVTVPLSFFRGVLMIISARYDIAFSAFYDAERAVMSQTSLTVGDQQQVYIQVDTSKRLDFERLIKTDGRASGRAQGRTILAAELEAEARKRTRDVIKFRYHGGQEEMLDRPGVT